MNVCHPKGTYYYGPPTGHETITIKKVLWDEMLSYKNKIDQIEDLFYDMQERIENRIELLDEKFHASTKGFTKLEEKIDTLETIFNDFISNDSDKIEKLNKYMIEELSKFNNRSRFLNI